MKKNKLLKSLTLTIVLLSAFIISCDFKGVTEDFEIELTNNVLEQEALVSVIDLVNPKNLEGNTTLKVELLGEDANKFVTNAGESVDDLKVVDGTISLAVNPNKASTDPIKVLLKISGNDYLTTTIPLVMFPDDTLVTKSINIVNKVNTVQGIDYIEKNKTLINNTISNEYKIITPKTKATTKTEIKIESGTIFQDANGNPISGGNIKSEVAHFSLDTPESIASFPGGLLPLDVVDENGEIVEGSSFLTAGFTSVDMFVDGTEVKNFSKPITIGVDIPNNYINPETGNNIAVGDEISIWSYDDDGQWSFHKKGTVNINSEGNFSIVFTTTHLSWYNLDYHYWGVCNYGRKLTVSIPAIPNLSDNVHQLYYEVVYASNNQIVGRRNTRVSKNRVNNTGFKNTPNSLLKIKVYKGSYYDKELLYTSKSFNGCSSNTITVDATSLTNITEPQFKNIRIQFSAKCGDKIFRPYLYLYRLESYTYNGKTYSYWRRVGYIWGGNGYIYRTKLGVSEKYRTYYNGEVYEYDYTFDSDNIIINDFEVPGDLCSMLL